MLYQCLTQWSRVDICFVGVVPFLQDRSRNFAFLAIAPLARLVNSTFIHSWKAHKIIQVKRVSTTDANDCIGPAWGAPLLGLTGLPGKPSVAASYFTWVVLQHGAPGEWGMRTELLLSRGAGKKKSPRGGPRRHTRCSEEHECCCFWLERNHCD